jgi:NADPH:quinone reductase-like Zn-dependent oxidoreductase
MAETKVNFCCYLDTMKAYYSKAYGNSEASAYGELPDPVAGPGQILVEIKAVSINPVDWKIRQGAARVVSGFRFPRIFGADFAGIVRETGPGVTAFSRGERIYGSKSILFDRGGALAELRAVEENRVRRIPEGMSYNEAASLPVAALTALNGLRKCSAGKGTEVLITGGTGGVGHFAVQIARAYGAQVVTTCSRPNTDLALKLWADETIDHSTVDLFSSGRKFDAIFDAHGHMNAWKVHRLMKSNGTYASTLFIPPPWLAIAMTRILHGKKLMSANMRSNDEDWRELERLFAEGSFRPVIENVFPLEQASDAFDLAIRGGFRGKIIVTV